MSKVERVRVSRPALLKVVRALKFRANYGVGVLEDALEDVSCVFTEEELRDGDQPADKVLIEFGGEYETQGGDVLSIVSVSDGKWVAKLLRDDGGPSRYIELNEDGTADLYRYSVRRRLASGWR